MCVILTGESNNQSHLQIPKIYPIQVVFNYPVSQLKLQLECEDIYSYSHIGNSDMTWTQH